MASRITGTTLPPNCPGNPPGLIIFLIHRSILLSFFRCPGLACVRMYDSGEQLVQPEEIQQRFKKVFERDMNRTERDVFFLPVEPSSEQEDNG
jgi:hypothetical protein